MRGSGTASRAGSSVRIEALTHHGLGRADDGSLWPRTLPGEEIDAAGRIVTPSPDRVTAPCPHFKSCGGCAVQHARDDLVARWKAGIVARALAAHDLTAPPRRIHTSPPATRRRAKLSGRRTRKGALVGFHARASDTIVAVPGCVVLDPALVALIPALEALTDRLASRKGEIALTVTASTAGADVQVSGGKDPEPQDRVDLAAWASAHDIARLTLGDEVIVTRRPPMQRFGAALVTPPPGGFLQATRAGEAALTAGLREALEGARRVADLFAGCGTFSLPLAESAEVHAVESLSAPLEALMAGWRQAQGLRRVTTEARDLFRRPLEHDELARFDAVALDPPRAGALAQCERLATGGPPRIGYVSCHPASFARDAARLVAGGYRLDWLDLVDQFGWSPHVELVAAFSR